MRILGIDPGTAITGFGLIEVKGNRFIYLDHGCILTDSNVPMEKRIQKIYENILELVDRYNPSDLAIEELFFNKNVQTALTVGQARGVVLLVGALKGLEIRGYTPLQVKQAVVGYGRAHKNQVQHMVKTFLNLQQLPKPDDAADALAIAICHAHFKQTIIRSGRV